MGSNLGGVTMIFRFFSRSNEKMTFMIFFWGKNEVYLFNMTTLELRFDQTKKMTFIIPFRTKIMTFIIFLDYPKKMTSDIYIPNYILTKK